MLGGRKSAKDDGLNIAHRDILYNRMSALPEGALFTQQDIATDPEEAADFAALRGYDYVHVLDGYFTRIVETKFVRMVPDPEDVIESYRTLKNICLTETGDRTAWKNGLKKWEPLEGYRYYSNGKDEILSLGHMKIRIINSPEWARSETPEASLFRCFYDQSAKDALVSLHRSDAIADISAADLKAAAEYAESIDPEDIPKGWKSPRETADQITLFLDNKGD